MLKYILIAVFAACFLTAVIVAAASKRRGIFALAALLLAAAGAVARTYITVFYVEQDTGFYLDSPIVPLFHGCMALLGVLAVVFFFALRKRAQTVTDGPRGLFSLASVFGVGAFCAALVGSFLPLAGGELNFSSVLMMFCALVSIAAMVLSLPVFSDRAKPEVSLVFLAPVLFTAVHLISSFIQHITVASVSEYLIDVVMMCCVMLFQFADAKCRSGHDQRAAMAATGLVSLIAISIACLPKFYFSVIGGLPVFSEPFNPVFASYLLLMPYITSRVCSVRRKIKYI